jgi:hypothetical protein
MATKSKKSAKRPPAKTAPKRKTTGDNKTQKVIALMRRPSGVTRDQVVKLTGWKAVSMQALAANAGVTLKVDNKERPFTYHCK